MTGKDRVASLLWSMAIEAIILPQVLDPRLPQLHQFRPDHPLTPKMIKLSLPFKQESIIVDLKQGPFLTTITIISEHANHCSVDPWK